MNRLVARTPGHEGEGEGVSRADRARVLLGVAVGPVVCGYAVVVTVLTVVIAVAPRAEFTVWGVLAASGPAWLAAYQVPLELSGGTLGVLPLLPTAGAGVLVARAASAAARKVGDLRPSTTVPVVVAVGGTHALVASVVVVLSADTAVAARLPQGVLTPALLSGLFALVGAGHA
ncbi:cell division protein PerM, partial [Saccharomonospora saliphila]|uniref:cell division protein PerM n=1 Tax=Saccharomonospora saliphila TaxID=369829 RepID=UPI001E2866EB